MSLNKKYLNKGNALLVTPIVVLFSMMIILSLGMFFVNAIKPFILYEKLNDISNKYMFVIERFGYLTLNEKNNLEKELKNSGFDLENISIEYPENQKSYGEVLEFLITYKYNLKFPNLIDNLIFNNDKVIDIVVKKHSFSKV